MTKDDFLYAISYSESWSKQSLMLFESDLKFMKSENMNFILPKDLNASSTTGIILIIECSSIDGLKDVCAIIKANEASAVFALDRGADEEIIKTVRKELGEEAAEFAYCFESCSENNVAVASIIAEAKMEFQEEYGEKCNTMIHKCGGLFCDNWDGFIEDDFFKGTKIFTYGNGCNEIEFIPEGAMLMTRIKRLSEWAIEDYFESIGKP